MPGVTMSAPRARSPNASQASRASRAAARNDAPSASLVSLGADLAEVLRPEEEDRVGREQHRMDPPQPARPRHATGDAAKRVQLGASWTLGTGRPVGGQPR